MLFQTRNFELIKDREKTYLTALVAVAGTTLTVRAVDANAWADNDWIIVGEIGAKNAEILQINGAVSDGTSLTIDNAGSGGARFSHAINEPVYRIDYNQVEFSHADTETGAKTVTATNELQVDDLFTRYEDVTNTTGYGFVRFKNSLTNAFSAYSDAIPYTGYTARSLGRMMRKVRRLLDNPSITKVSDEDITEELNDQQRNVAHERLWPFYENTFSTSRVAYQREYPIASGVVVGKAHTVIVDSEPLAKIDVNRMNMLNWDTNTTGEPTRCLVWNNKLVLYPLQTSSATATTLNGAISSATATTITLTSVSGFRAPGRALIDDEVISYEATNSSNQLLGCQRGLEGTTATTHLDGATVTERDIIYTGHEEPTDLVDIQDETEVPDPDVLVYGASANIALQKLQDQVLHDRLVLKHEKAIDALRNKFGKKFTSASFRIKDVSEVVTDSGRLEDPNRFPENITD